MPLKCNIATLRYDKRITQEDLSKASGLTVNQISEYENNRTYPNAINLWKLAKAIGCKVDDLYEEE